MKEFLICAGVKEYVGHDQLLIPGICMVSKPGKTIEKEKQEFCLRLRTSAMLWFWMNGLNIIFCGPHTPLSDNISEENWKENGATSPKSRHRHPLDDGAVTPSTHGR